MEDQGEELQSPFLQEGDIEDVSPLDIEKLHWRKKLEYFLEHERTQIAIMVLVVLDVIFVLTEIILDLMVEKTHTTEEISHILHIIGLIILGIFLVEIFAKMIAMDKRFFKSFGNVFDAIVVITAFILELVFYGNESSDAISLFIILRLWRVVRIIHGIIHSAEVKAEKKIKAIEEQLESTKEELWRANERIQEEERRVFELGKEIRALRQQMADHSFASAGPSSREGARQSIGGEMESHTLIDLEVDSDDDSGYES